MDTQCVCLGAVAVGTSFRVSAESSDPAAREAWAGDRLPAAAGRWILGMQSGCNAYYSTPYMLKRSPCMQILRKDLITSHVQDSSVDIG